MKALTWVHRWIPFQIEYQTLVCILGLEILPYVPSQLSLLSCWALPSIHDLFPHIPSSHLAPPLLFLEGTILFLLSPPRDWGARHEILQLPASSPVGISACTNPHLFSSDLGEGAALQDPVLPHSLLFPPGLEPCAPSSSHSSVISVSCLLWWNIYIQ